MKFSTMALVLSSAVVIAGAGVSAVACSSSSTTGNPVAQNDASKSDTSMPGTDSSPPVMDAGPTPDTGTGGDTGPGGPDCGSIPTLHPGDGVKLFCPFGPDGGAIDCVAKTQFCCISGKVGGAYPPSSCEPIANGACAAVEAGVAGSTEIECEDPGTDCPAGNMCCGTPNSIAPVAGCGYGKLAGWQYTKCATSCTGTEFQLCASDAECGDAGKKCASFKAKGIQLGYCM